MNNKKDTPYNFNEPDEVLLEVWRAKDAISAAYGHDLDRLFEALREGEKHSGHPVVDLSRQTDANGMTPMTIPLDPDLLRALRLKAMETSRPFSDLVNDAIREAFVKEAAGLDAVEAREAEPAHSYKVFLKELKRSGKL